MKRLILALAVLALWLVIPVNAEAQQACFGSSCSSGGTSTVTGASIAQAVTCTDAVGTDAYACTPTTCTAALDANTPPVFVDVATANTGGATFAFCGTAAKAVVRAAGASVSTALVTGDVLARQVLLLKYSVTNDNWQMLDPSAASVTSDTGITQLTGDVTAGPGSGTQVATIAANTVTLAKIGFLAQDQFIGRVTASTGTPETATITAAARTVLDDASVSAMVDTLGGTAAQGSGAIVRATSPTLTTPALGTPTALVGTNITGTASGLTAGSVTTNANLTGPITSVGNATTIASLSTGTGLPLTTGVTGTLPVANGGSGVAATTVYAPLFGGTTTTGPFQSGTVGTAGQVLKSNGAGALPTFQAQSPTATTGPNYCPDAGASDAYVCAVTGGPLASLATGTKLLLYSNTVNTGTASVNPDSLGVKTITRWDGTTLATGDINIGWNQLVYDGTNFRLMGYAGATRDFSYDPATSVTTLANVLKIGGTGINNSTTNMRIAAGASRLIIGSQGLGDNLTTFTPGAGWNFGTDTNPDCTYAGVDQLAPTAGTMTRATRGCFKTSTSSFTWSNAQVAALGASTTGDITVGTLAAKTQVTGALVVITGVAAGTTTLTVSCGDAIGGTPFINYILPSSAQAAANTVYGDAANGSETGTSLFDAVYHWLPNYLPSYTATTLVTCHFISTGGNLSAVTGSTGRVILTTTVLP